MNLRDSIREWLGITEMSRVVGKINNDLDELDRDIRQLRRMPTQHSRTEINKMYDDIITQLEAKHHAKV